MNLRRAQSEGGTVSHISANLGRTPAVIELSDDDEEGPRLRTRSKSGGIFVTPAPGERSTGTPDDLRRSSSARLRRASGAPRAVSSLHNVVDLTQDSDKEDKEDKEEAPAADGTGRAERARKMTGRKRSRRVTSPPSEDEDRSELKKLKSVQSKPGSVLKQDWEFPA